MSNWLRIGLYGGLHFVQLFTSLLTLGGIADQARYGPSKVCILFIEDYRDDVNNPGYYLFSANSTSCSGIMGLAAAGMILALVIGGVSLYYIIRSEFRAVRLIFGMAILAAGYTAIAFIMAVVAAAGIDHTCKQFQGAGFSCGTIFTGGFFETDTQSTFTKNLGVIQMSVVSAWFCFASWAAYTALEFLNWRNSV
ncbi:hypothetical protein DFJ73DRAFT_843066 [Zopfochytrium polystomum]|nr:hypothetical protein DFJ73DRAFT_843066 [Zopfochytrium polystomum]